MSLAHHLELIHMTDMMLFTEFKHKVEAFVVNEMESNEETVEVFPELISCSALHRLEAFVGWLSENEVTEEQKKEIVESFTFEELSAEDLLTGVRDSGLFSSKKIDERLLDILKKKDQLLKEKEKKIKELRKTLEVTTKYPIPPYLKY